MYLAKIVCCWSITPILFRTFKNNGSQSISVRTTCKHETKIRSVYEITTKQGKHMHIRVIYRPDSYVQVTENNKIDADQK